MNFKTESIPEKLYIQIIQFGHIVGRHHFINRENYEDKDIPRSQAILLKVLLEKEKLTNKDIVEILDIRPSSAGELVKKLEKNEYIKREINSEDKRVYNIFLTEKGKKKAQIITNSRNKKVEEIFKGLTKDEQEQLSELLEKLISSFKDFESNEKIHRHIFHHDHHHGHGRGHHHGHMGNGPWHKNNNPWDRDYDPTKK
jgi:DNA-binding MarR family transcriptional regulator